MKLFRNSYFGNYMTKASTWFKSSQARLWRHITLWLLFYVILRYMIVGSIYKDTRLVEDWVSIGQVIQTVLLYYFFGYYVFPRYLYNLQFLKFLSWVLTWHILFYEMNYVFFWYLQQINVSSKIERDWAIFQSAGLYGFFNSVNTAVYSFLYSFSFVFILLGILAVRDTISIKTRNLQLEKDKLNLELDFLRSQINPHSLFNVLNSVYANVFETNEKAADLVLRLSELMRYNLYEADTPRIALDKELTYVQNYLDLERNRLGEQDISIDYDQNGPVEQYQIAPLLLIAFVENAFKHGIRGAYAVSYVEVYASIEDGKFTFLVENSVPPKRVMKTETKDPIIKSGGVGLSNVRRRLDALYGGQYEWLSRPREKSYTVVLTMQLEPTV